MKTLAIIAALALTASVAHADPVIVAAPKGQVTEAAAQAYVEKLEKAVKQVCYDAFAPAIGINHYLYLDCIKDTRQQVAKDDPTGLYASRSGQEIVVASK